MGQTIRLGIDVACRAEHQASCADASGEFLWSGWRFRTNPADLERLWAKVPDGAEVTVVLKPTRNAWVPLAGWLRAKGAKVVMVPPEQSADLRDYYNKHTKTDRLDSRILARLPLLHPDGLRPIDHLGPVQPLLRAVRLRSSLVKRRTATAQRLDCLVELLGPAWGDVLGTGDYNKSSLAVLERFADPRALKKLGRKRLSTLLIRASRGAWRESKADDLLAAADESIELWVGGGLDFESWPPTSPPRSVSCATSKVSAEVRAARKRAGKAQQMKRAGRGRKESTKAAPAYDPPDADAIQEAGVA